MVGEVALKESAITCSNCPDRQPTDSLIMHINYRYKGKAQILTFDWQVGQGITIFDGITERQAKNLNQPESPNGGADWGTYTADLPSISLNELSPREDPYDAEVKASGDFGTKIWPIRDVVRIPTAIAADVEITTVWVS